MKIEITDYVENEDGSADMQLHSDDEATKFLVQEGFISLIKKAIDETKNDICTDKQ